MTGANLAVKPQPLSHAAAATLPLAALTAWQALVDHAALQYGGQELVQGGAGGVGIFAIQLAAILGGHVTATGRSAPTPDSCGTTAEGFIGREAGSQPDQELEGSYKVHAMFFVVEPDANELARLAEMGRRPSKAAEGPDVPARRSSSFAE
jgi:NADPH:quinone reductase-like Zn-dependent oxidoreductase